tara:strand:+ start:90 stop:287 length:198 start_codon:yes stop_codon:yes gene_type:complete
MIPPKDKDLKASFSVFSAKPQIPYLFSLFPMEPTSIKDEKSSSESTKNLPPREYATVGYYQEGYV